MGMRKRFPDNHKPVGNTKRWAALRLMAKRRDGFKCVQCGARGRLEVDHIKPVRTHPELAFDLANCQTLCPRCHTKKSRIECGFGEPDPRREAWKQLVADMRLKPSQAERKTTNA